MNISAISRELTPAGQRILEVASQLFYQYGIRAVGVDMIAREAGVTKKTIYDRFGSKDGLIERYLQTRDRVWHDLIREHVERDDLGPRDRILAMFDILDLQMRDRGCAFINAHAEFGGGEDGQIAYRLTRKQKVWLKSYFRDLAEAAGASRPDELAIQLLLLHEGTFVAYAMAGEHDAYRHARDAAEVILDAALQR